MTTTLTDLLTGDGIYSHAIIPADAVDDNAVQIYDRWLAGHHNAAMAFAERYADVRRDPRTLLDAAHPGVRVNSLIICLFPFASSPAGRPVPNPSIAEYALGGDYHYAIRRRLLPVCRHLESEYNAVSAVCVDSAPLRERYWAQQAGLGIVTRNNFLTVPGIGAHFLIGSVATSAVLDTHRGPYTPTPCPDNCTLCRDACPANALQADGSCLTERCLSYLSIEAPHPVRSPIFGCDLCRRACPHHHPERLDATPLPELTPRPDILALTPETFAALTRGQKKKLTVGSPLSRRR